jgi:hypothetical protein
MDKDDIILALLGIGALVVLALVWFIIGILIAYATGWMLENWFGWCDVNTTIYRTVAIPLIVFGGLRASSSKD